MALCGQTNDGGKGEGGTAVLGLGRPHNLMDYQALGGEYVTSRNSRGQISMTQLVPTLELKNPKVIKRDTGGDCAIV